MAAAKCLTKKQRECLIATPKEYFYITYGDISKKWWIQCSKLDKYLGGYDSKEQAEEVIQTGAYLSEEALWYSGNTLVL